MSEGRPDFNQGDWAWANPRYPLELLLLVLTVSVETMKIVRSLPPLDLSPEGIRVLNKSRSAEWTRPYSTVGECKRAFTQKRAHRAGLLLSSTESMWVEALRGASNRQVGR
jgi:hypothetical protein